MMPISMYDNTKVKIYSTAKGIKIIDSPIKIQILNILEGKVSEAEIVKKTGKSKSTISVHLKNLIEDGIISFQSHPLDRRSKLFYIFAEYIGEIYPDKIIYNIPQIEHDVTSDTELYIEVFRQFKSLLLYHGLEVEPLEVESGYRIGEKLYSTFEYETLEELLEILKKTFKDLKLGNLTVNNTEELIFKIKGCHECYKLQYNIPTCNITKGIIKGIFTGHFKEKVSVEEVECCSKYDDCCTFIVEH